MSALPPSQTSELNRAMSALCQKRTLCIVQCSKFKPIRSLRRRGQLTSFLVPNYCQSHVLNSSYRNGPRMLAQIREHRVRHLESGETM